MEESPKRSRRFHAQAPSKLAESIDALTDFPAVRAFFLTSIRTVSAFGDYYRCSRRRHSCEMGTDTLLSLNKLRCRYRRQDTRTVGSS